MNIKNLSLFILIVGLLRLITLGFYPLMDNTEARYAEIAREMVTTNEWITPQLDPGVPFWAKPPLSIWATAVGLKIFGINEFGARISSFLFSVLTCFLVYLLGFDLRNKTFGLLCVAILSTIGMFFVMSGSVMTDPALNFSVNLSLVSFMIFFGKKARASRMFWGYMFFVGLGLSLLAKGPVGWILTGIPIFFWAFIHRTWGRIFRELPWIQGLLLVAVIAVPWHILAEKKTPGFLDYYFVGEHWKRFTVSNWRGDLYGSGHAQPKGMIWLFGIPGTLPWLVVLVPILYRFRQIGKGIKGIFVSPYLTFLLFWFLAPFLFFTLSSNITTYYILPGLSAFAILLAYGIVTLSVDHIKEQEPWYLSPKKLAYIAAIVPLTCSIAAFTILPIIGNSNSQAAIARMFLKNVQNSDTVIYYTQSKKYSADFYSKGRAVELAPDFNVHILQELYDGEEDFYVTRKDFKKHLPAEFFNLTKDIKHSGKFILFQER